MPRSGTSLVEQIISSHHKVYGGGELTFLKDIIESKVMGKLNYKDLKNMKNFETFLNNIDKEYYNKISLIDNSNKVFTDKTPLNFKYIGFIRNIFPNSKIINCERNSLDVCWSNYKNYFGENLPFSNNLKDLGNYYNLYRDLTKFWKKIFPNEIYELNYNNLIENSESEIRNILKFCNLEWDPNCLRHEKNKKTIKTASATQARNSINKSGLNTHKPFKKYLDDLSRLLNN